MAELPRHWQCTEPVLAHAHPAFPNHGNAFHGSLVPLSCKKTPSLTETCGLMKLLIPGSKKPGIKHLRKKDPQAVWPHLVLHLGTMRSRPLNVHYIGEKIKLGFLGKGAYAKRRSSPLKTNFASSSNRTLYGPPGPAVVFFDARLSSALSTSQGTSGLNAKIWCSFYWPFSMPCCILDGTPLHDVLISYIQLHSATTLP